MLYAISIWTFLDEEHNIGDLIEYFTENGFNAISLNPENIVNADKKQLNDILSIQLLVEKYNVE